MALYPGGTISGAYGYSGGTPLASWAPSAAGLSTPAYAQNIPPLGYVANPAVLPGMGVTFGTAKPAVFNAWDPATGGLARTPSEPLSDVTLPRHKGVPAIGTSDPRYNFFKSGYGGRRKTRRRRGGGTNPSEWIVELYRTPTRETLDRVVGEIRRSPRYRNVALAVNTVMNMLRFPLGARETRESRLAEVIRRVILHLREEGGPIPPPNAENVKGLLGLKGVSRRGFAPGGTAFPEDVENRLVGFLAPSGKDDPVGRGIGEIAVLKDRRLPRPAGPPAPPPGGYGPGPAGGPGGPPPAGGRRRTRRRGGAMTKSIRELQRDLEADPSKSTLDNVLTDLRASGNDVLEAYARGLERNLQEPLRAGETMDSRVRENVERVVGILRMYGRGRRKTTQRRR